MIAAVTARVLAIAQASGLGGAEYGLLRIACRLPRLGFDLELTVPEPGPLADAASGMGIVVHTLATGGLRRGAWPRAVWSWPRAHSLLRRVTPDLVYLNGAITQRLTPAFEGVKIVPHLHDLLDATPRPWRSERFWRSAPVVLSDSEAVSRSAAAAGAPAERLRTVYCPVDPVEPAERPAWAGGGPIVGYVGRVEARKGTLDLLAAAALLLERRPDVRIVLAGDDDFAASRAYRRRVAELAETLGERVLMLGRVDDAARLMPWFDVLAVPSHKEPFGTVAAEALAAGTPVVATRSGGMEEYVVPGRNGALVDPADPEALSAALADLLEQGTGMAAAARKDAERFGSDRVATSVASALREALDA